MKNIVFDEIISEICEEENIKREELSYGYVTKLSKDNKTHFIIDYCFDINSGSSIEIAGDKYATYDVLKNKHEWDKK